MLIKELPKSLRPREKAMEYGIDSLDDRELIALFLRTGTKNKSVLQLADEVIVTIGGLNQLINVDIRDLLKIKGINTIKALELVAISEISKRMLQPGNHKLSEDININEIINWLMMSIGHEFQEHFVVVFLNKHNRVIGSHVLSIGTLDMAVLHPRDILREGLKLNATQLILVHNHPQGTLRPSSADIEATINIVEASLMVNIKVVDHLILAQGHFISIKEEYPHVFKI